MPIPQKGIEGSNPSLSEFSAELETDKQKRVECSRDTSGINKELGDRS